MVQTRRQWREWAARNFQESEEQCEECQENEEEEEDNNFEYSMDNSTHEQNFARADNCNRHRAGRPTPDDKWIPGHYRRRPA